MNQFDDIQSDLSEHFTIDLDDKHEDEAEVDFSFVCNVNDEPPTSVLNIGAQIKPVFPLFGLDLLSDYDSESSDDRLDQMKLFAETHLSSESDESDGISSGPFCVWTKNSKDKKNNSTGFSKLWRFRKSMNRSNSDGRDALVFLKNWSKKEKVEVAEKRAGGQSSPRNNNGSSSGGGVRGKVKGMGNAHEIYIKNKAIKNEDRRRSYLPYRPELFGFFTNVHGGGLSRNVHPY